MPINTHGGGAQTNVNGLKFEQDTKLAEALLNIQGYEIHNDTVFYNNKEIGKIGSQHGLYRVFLKPNNIDYKDIISKQLRPDDAIYIHKSNTIYIIEKKFQKSAGSVDEKLQTCDFKKKQYEKLFAPLGYKVEYIYVLNNWFKHARYDDVKDYIKKVGCHYHFNEIPLSILGLPHNEVNDAN
ncbi:MAG: hypothetical protein K9L74_04615 [Candidatus Izimaplasma sp.]|nr:hypothetical protein [Candidatus Izimaplasma bacterium]